MTHLDLCTGIGGFHLAAEWAGFRTIGFAEVEPYCCKLLAEKWPEIPNYGDIRTADFRKLRGNVTVLSAGVPCQPASLAGKRRGACDDRWLWPAVLDVVRDVQPAWCIFENPPGILTLDEFGGVLLRLGSLGHQVRAFGVPANAVGADTEGYRTFIVAQANCDRSQWRWSMRNEANKSGAYVTAPRPDQEPCVMASTLCQGLPTSGISIGYEPEFTEARCALPNHVWLPTDPRVYRSFDGLPNRAHRLKALGNSVCPQQAYPFFEAIAQVEK